MVSVSERGQEDISGRENHAAEIWNPANTEMREEQVHIWDHRVGALEQSQILEHSENHLRKNDFHSVLGEHPVGRNYQTQRPEQAFELHGCCINWLWIRKELEWRDSGLEKWGRGENLRRINVVERSFWMIGAWKKKRWKNEFITEKNEEKNTSQEGKWIHQENDKAVLLIF